MKKYSGLIFDLDQTLVDSAFLEPFRLKRRWKEVYSRIPEIKAFPGIDAIFDYVERKKLDSIIVTNSPRSYCERIVDLFKWPIKGWVCYHDVSNIKPDPEPIQKALTYLKLQPSEVIAIGDRYNDCLAAFRANIGCVVGVVWGNEELIAKGSNGREFELPVHHLFYRPIDLLDFLKKVT